MNINISLKKLLFPCISVTSLKKQSKSNHPRPLKKLKVWDGLFVPLFVPLLSKEYTRITGMNKRIKHNMFYNPAMGTVVIIPKANTIPRRHWVTPDTRHRIDIGYINPSTKNDPDVTEIYFPPEVTMV